MYTVLVAGGGLVLAVGWLSFKWGAWSAATKITRRLQGDREFALAIVEDLAQRHGVKIQREEMPGQAAAGAP